jgi:hypothetical protein
MLASITPLGERGRGQRWPVTVGSYALGAATAGALAGIVLGAAGGWLGLGGRQTAARLLGLAGLLALGAALDGLHRVPGPRRQVDERWLDAFRGWVYGLGFGAQMGVGYATVITSAATFCAGGAALLSGSAAAGGAILGLYGLVRGVTPALTVGVDTPAQLFALHAWLERWRVPVRWGAVGGLLVLAAVAAVGAA